RQIGEKLDHLRLRFEVMLRRAFWPVLIADIFSRRDTEQRIMRLIHVAARKKHLIGRDERNIEIIGELEKAGLGALFNGEPVPLDLHIEAAWENLHQRARVAFRRRLLIRRDKPPERPADT